LSFPPFALSPSTSLRTGLSKGRSWFDRLTTNGLARDAVSGIPFSSSMVLVAMGKVVLSQRRRLSAGSRPFADPSSSLRSASGLRLRVTELAPRSQRAPRCRRRVRAAQRNPPSRRGRHGVSPLRNGARRPRPYTWDLRFARRATPPPGDRRTRRLDRMNLLRPSQRPPFAKGDRGGFVPCIARHLLKQAAVALPVQESPRDESSVVGIHC